MKRNKNGTHIKLSKDIEWLRPFIDITRYLVDLKKLTHIKSYRVRPGLNELAYGMTHYSKNKFYITIRTTKWSKSKKQYLELDKGHIIDTLAHELSHLECWEHDIDHFDLQTRIMRLYIPLLRKYKVNLWD